MLQLPASELGQGLGSIPPPWQALISVSVPVGVPQYQRCFKHDSTKRSVSRQPREISGLPHATHGLPDASLCLAPSPIPSCISLPSFLTLTKCYKLRRCFRLKVQNSLRMCGGALLLLNNPVSLTKPKMPLSKNLRTASLDHTLLPFL